MDVIRAISLLFKMLFLLEACLPRCLEFLPIPVSLSLVLGSTIFLSCFSTLQTLPDFPSISTSLLFMPSLCVSLSLCLCLSLSASLSLSLCFCVSLSLCSLLFSLCFSLSFSLSLSLFLSVSLKPMLACARIFTPPHSPLHHQPHSDLPPGHTKDLPVPRLQTPNLRTPD